nr:E3 ubiquitin-protein ligase SlrP [Candidatus Anoxychlamydiales bacterium]
NRKQIDIDLIKICKKIANQLPNLNQLMNNEDFTELNNSKKAAILRNILNDQANQAAIQRIQDLDLSGLFLKTLPDELNLFTGLTTLSLWRNNLTALPVGFLNNARVLKTLSLMDNKLETLPVGFLNNATALKNLNLNGTQLTALPIGFLNNATALETLCLNDNKLTALPANFLDDARSLERLWLDNNKLTTLPIGDSLLKRSYI